MAELDEKEMGFLQAIFAKLGFSPKAESEEPKAMEEEEEEEAKAEDSEEAPEAKEESQEEVKAEDEDDKEMEALKAKVAELETALEAKLDVEIEAEKHALIFEAIKENKLTLAEGRDSMALGLSDVQAKVKEAVISPSGYEKQHNNIEAPVNHAEEYLALTGNEQTAYFSKHEKSIINEMNKDK